MNQDIKTRNGPGLETFSAILIRCFGICVFILLVWFLWSITFLDFGYQFYDAWFGITRQEFVMINLYAMAGFKVMGFIFFLIPWLAVRLPGIIANDKNTFRKKTPPT